MDSIFNICMAVLFGVACGVFQYWMAVRLDRKRWLLWLQPALFAAIALCFLGWTLSLDGLEQSSARLASLPFFYLLVCVVAGWIVARVRHGKPPKPPEAGDGKE